LGVQGQALQAFGQIDLTISNAIDELEVLLGILQIPFPSIVLGDNSAIPTAAHQPKTPHRIYH